MYLNIFWANLSPLCVGYKNSSKERLQHLSFLLKKITSIELSQKLKAFKVTNCWFKTQESVVAPLPHEVWMSFILQHTPLLISDGLYQELNYSLHLVTSSAFIGTVEDLERCVTLQQILLIYWFRYDSAWHSYFKNILEGHIHLINTTHMSFRRGRAGKGRGSIPLIKAFHKFCSRF